MFLNKNQFPSLTFCGTHTKPNGVRGFSKHCDMRFDTKLGHGTCTIGHIPCTCAEFISMLDKHWIHGFTPQQQQLYKPATNCSY